MTVLILISMTLTKTGMECFFGGQVWAVYDTLDAMPGFYAQIKKVSLLGSICR